MNLFDIWKYFGIAGSTVPDTPGATVPAPANHRRLRCDNAGYLEVIAGGGAPMDVNLQEVAGTATVEGGVAGSQGVGGLAADGDAAAGNPNLAGGLYEVAAAARDDGDVVPIGVDSRGRIKNVGAQADDTAADDGSFPVKVGAVIRNVLIGLTDGRTNSLLVDLLGRLHTRSAAFDELLDADKEARVNPESSNHDAAAQIICDETNLAASANFPSNDGIEIGDRDFLSFTLSLNDVTSVAFEVSNEGTNWYDGTKNVVVDGTSGHLATYFTSAAGVTTLFACDWQRCGFRYIRCAVTIPNATNVIYIDLIQRAL